MRSAASRLAERPGAAPAMASSARGSAAQPVDLAGQAVGVELGLGHEHRRPGVGQGAGVGRLVVLGGERPRHEDDGHARGRPARRPWWRRLGPPPGRRRRRRGACGLRSAPTWYQRPSGRSGRSGERPLPSVPVVVAGPDDVADGEVARGRRWRPRSSPTTSLSVPEPSEPPTTSTTKRSAGRPSSARGRGPVAGDVDVEDARRSGAPGHHLAGQRRRRRRRRPRASPAGCRGALAAPGTAS